jgi:hypothetical protein
MKNLYLLLLAALLPVSKVNAAVGDTTVVHAHQNYIINWYGNYNQWAVFPAQGTSYSKVLMKYTLSQPQLNTEWDYTTNVFANIRTGTYDSTATPYPVFTVNGNTVDTFYFNPDPVYVYFYNSSTQATDSGYASTIQVMLFNDPQNPSNATDSLLVYPGNFYNYIYDATGAVTDSLYVPADSTWILSYMNVYTVFEVKDPIELARVMTPYGAYYSPSWSFDYWFDVTDYLPILHDSVEMTVRYEGYSDGYAFSVSFFMIEGTPARTPLRVRNVYQPGYYEYGITTNPIESHLTPVDFDITTSETNAMMRVIPSGHSFGGALNCAEFCNKSFHLLVDGTQQYSKNIWRSDCGLNPLWHQAGTWLFDRSNWCPGSKTLNKDQELTPFITPGDSVTLEMNMDPYTYSGGAGFNPGYILSAQLFTYGSPNFTTDATVEEILKPNADANYARYNPICNNPIVVIKNGGSDPLTSVTIKYGIRNGTPQYYNWTGSLGFLETATVDLDSMTWGGSTSGEDHIFEVALSNPNGIADQNPYNDTLRSVVNFTPVYPQTFRLFWRTNNAASETSYKIYDESGAILYSSPVPLSANTSYADTFTFAPGCYEFRMTDTGKDGLAFFANSDGTGFARFMQANGTASWIKSFEADFGTSIVHYFTVGFATGISEQKQSSSFSIYPNPATGNVTIEHSLTQDNIRVSVYNVQGQNVLQHLEPSSASGKFDMDVSALPPGIYIVQISAGGATAVKKLVRQ